MQAPDAPAETVPLHPEKAPPARPPAPTRIPAIIVGLIAAVIAGLSIWYLVRPQPLLVQGEVDATRLDIAARVDGRVADIPVERGENVAAGAVLVRIDNPETLAKHEQALAAKVVADAQLANIKAGTRAEVIAARKAALERAQASVILAQKTYDRISQLAEHGNAPQARLDQVTDALHESQRATDQAKSAYEQAVNGYTAEERGDLGCERAKGSRRHRGRAVDHRPDGDHRAGGLAGVQAQRGAGRVCFARRAAGDADRSQRPVDPLRPAGGSGQDAEDRRPLRCANSGARRSPPSPSRSS